MPQEYFAHTLRMIHIRCRPVRLALQSVDEQGFSDRQCEKSEGSSDLVLPRRPGAVAFRPSGVVPPARGLFWSGLLAPLGVATAPLLPLGLVGVLGARCSTFFCPPGRPSSGPPRPERPLPFEASPLPPAFCLLRVLIVIVRVRVPLMLEPNSWCSLRRSAGTPCSRRRAAAAAAAAAPAVETPRRAPARSFS